MTQMIEQFSTRFAAGSPGFYVNTQEEARLDGLLAEIAAIHGLHIQEWNLGAGPVRFDNKQPLDSVTARPELVAFLEWLRLESQYENQLIVIKNARLALENDRHAIAKLRQLLNLIERHHAGKAAVLLVSESWQPPQDIEAQLTQLKLPLPNLDEILVQLQQMSQTLGLEIPGHLRSQAATRLCGLDQKEIERVIKQVSRQSDVLDENALGQMLQAKEQRIAQSGLLEMIQTSESLADIGGLQNLKSWLTRKSKILKRLPEAQKARIQLPKGCLIAGIPGCGKSLSAKVAAHEFGQPLLRLDIGSMLGKYVGESEHNMRRALALAEAVSPCVLWVDELEKAFVGLSSGASEVSARLLGNFLTWMQERTSPVFVIATANDVTITPPELLRKGRFDEIFYVGFPNLKERQDILSIHLRKLGQDGKVFDLSMLAQRCRDFTGADIQNALNDALESAFIDGRSLEQADLEAAIKQTVPLRVTLRDKIGEYEELFDRLKLTPASEEDEMSIAKMSKWATDENPIRRKAVAGHADCPDDLLEKLAEDQERIVQEAVLKNSSCPEKILAKRLAIKPDSPNFDASFFELAASHESSPLDLLFHLRCEERLTKGARVAFAKRTIDRKFYQALSSENITIEIPDEISLNSLDAILLQIKNGLTQKMHEKLTKLTEEAINLQKKERAQWKKFSATWKEGGIKRLHDEDWDVSEIFKGTDSLDPQSESYRAIEGYGIDFFKTVREIEGAIKLPMDRIRTLGNKEKNFFLDRFFQLFSLESKKTGPEEMDWLRKYNFKCTRESELDLYSMEFYDQNMVVNSIDRIVTSALSSVANQLTRFFSNRNVDFDDLWKAIIPMTIESILEGAFIKLYNQSLHRSPSVLPGS